jgi:hypothetical protein
LDKYELKLTQLPVVVDKNGDFRAEQEKDVIAGMAEIKLLKIQL